MVHELKPRPYSDKEAKALLGSVVDAETADWHYNKHHKGYVDKRNVIEEDPSSGRAPSNRQICAMGGDL